MYVLTYSQREVLQALVTLYEKKKSLIKSKDIAIFINKNEGTIRNIIASLKALGLVDSKTGPAGGYRPTLKAYEYLRSPTMPLISGVKIVKNNVKLDLEVTNVEFMDITNRLGNKAVLRVIGDISQIREGDVLKVGPIPYSRLVIEGKVLCIDRYRREVVIDVSRVVSIPKEIVKNLISRDLIYVPPNITIKEAAKVLSDKGIRGVPVIDEEGNVLGLITSADILKAIVNNDTDAPITKYMRKEVIKINYKDDILSAIKLMLEKNIGRLLVINDEGKPIGLITRTDILRKISSLELLS